MSVLTSSLILVVATASTATASSTLPHVTIVGDSVLTAVLWDAAPRSILGRGLDVQLEVGICRRLNAPSCSADAGPVPSLVELADSLGLQPGSTVVVEMGYNEPAETFPVAVGQSIEALLDAGVSTILWVNLHDWQPQYTDMNNALALTVKRYPQVGVVDWATVSRDRYSWFQGDGIHLTYDGAVAMATLLHRAIFASFAPPLQIVSTRLQTAVVGHPYANQLAASGGTAPYTWRLVGSPPKGLHVLARGAIRGIPVIPSHRVFTARVTDSWGVSTSRRLIIDVTASAPPAPTPIPTVKRAHGAAHGNAG
jgi:hypothetical protein